MSKPLSPSQSPPSLPPHSRGSAPIPAFPCHILSDLHLGHFASKIQQPKQLEALFQGAASVLFAGDTSEAHIPHFAPKAQALRTQLLNFLHSQDIQIIELPGNHDPAIANHTHALLADAQVLILHGDAFFHHGIPWGRELKRSLPALEKVTQAFAQHLDKETAEEQAKAEDQLSRANAWARAMIPPDYSDSEITSLTHRLRHYAKLLFPPKRVFCMADAVLSAGTRACNFAEEFFPQARFIIHGHTHLGRILTHRGRIAINTGAFVRIASPRLVILEENQLRVHPIAQKGTDFFPKNQSHCWKLPSS